MDQFMGGGDTDAYIRCDYMGRKLKTKAISQKNGEVQWLEEMCIPAQIPIVSKRIVFRVYDEDTTGDELIGSMVFDMEKLIERRENG